MTVDTKLLPPVEVPGEGTFIFFNRTMDMDFSIMRLYSQHTGGQSPVAPELERSARIRADLEVLIFKAPDGWPKIADMPLRKNTWARLVAVHGALRAREDEFLDKQDKSSKGNSA